METYRKIAAPSFDALLSNLRRTAAAQGCTNLHKCPVFAGFAPDGGVIPR